MEGIVGDTHMKIHVLFCYGSYEWKKWTRIKQDTQISALVSLKYDHSFSWKIMDVSIVFSGENKTLLSREIKN